MSLLKNTKWALGVIALLTVGIPTARATPFVVVSTLGTNPTDGGSRVANGFTAYLIQVVTDNGKFITGVDVGGPSAATLGDGLFGTFLQKWSITDDGELPTPTGTARFTPASISSLDSHFLFSMADLNNLAISSQPTEDNTGINAVGSPNDTATSDFGVGTSMTMTFGVQAIAQSSSLDLAYVILPTGQLGSYAMDVATEDNSSKVHLVGVIPEPGSATLIGSALGLLLSGRRRR